MEDFVSLEIAKKLKDKGFYYPCIGHYVNNQLYIAHYQNAFHNDTNESIDAPTISQVLKWLRKEKKMHIIIPASFDQGYWWEVRDFNREISEYSDVEDTSYEESALAGIKYVLDNLI